MVSTPLVCSNRAGSAVPMLRLLLGGMLLGLPALFWYELLESFESVKSILFQLGGLGLLVVGIHASGGRSWPERWHQLRNLFAGPIGGAVLAAVGSACLSTVFSICPRTSLQGASDSYAGLGSVLAFALVYAASRAVGRNPRQIPFLFHASVLGLALALGYALVQIVSLDPLTWRHTSPFHSWVRPMGTQGHPNALAGHLVLVLPFLLALILRATSWRRYAGTGLLLLTVLVLLATLSRGGWLAAALAGSLFVVGWFKETPRKGFSLQRALLAVGLVALLLIGCLLLGGGFFSSLLQRLVHLSTSPARQSVWHAAWQIFLAHPMLGSGLDTFTLAFTPIRGPEYWTIEWGILPRRAHNDLLHALATQGIVGGLAYLALPLILSWTWVRAWKEHPQDRRLLLVLGSVVVAFYAQNFVGFALSSTSCLLAVVAGLLSRYTEKNRKEVFQEDHSTSSLLPLTAIATLVVLLSLILGTPPERASRLLPALGILLFPVALALCLEPRQEQIISKESRIGFRSLSWEGIAAGIIALPIGWWIVSPLLSSGLAYQAERIDPIALALRFHQWATRLSPGQDGFHLRLASAHVAMAEQVPDTPLHRKHLQQARLAVEQACRLAPRLASHHAHRGKILTTLAKAGLADPAEAQRAFAEALRLDAWDTITLAEAAHAAVMLGQLDEAERLIERGILLDSSYGPLHTERAAVLLARAMPAMGLTPSSKPSQEALLQAEQILERLSELQWPDEERLGRARLLFAMVCLERQRLEQALIQVRAVRQSLPDWVQAHWLEGVVLERLGQHLEALRVYQEVMHKHPGNAQAKAGMARLMSKAPRRGKQNALPPSR